MRLCLGRLSQQKGTVATRWRRLTDFGMWCRKMKKKKGMHYCMITWAMRALTNSSRITAASTQSCWAGPSAWVSISDCRKSSKHTCRWGIMEPVSKGWVRGIVLMMEHHWPFPPRRGWSSSPAAEPPGPCRRRAAAVAGSANPGEHQNLRTWCWHTRRTRSGFGGCLKRRK